MKRPDPTEVKRAQKAWSCLAVHKLRVQLGNKKSGDKVVDERNVEEDKRE